MPLYEYYCTECDLKFDLLQRMNEAGKSALCPSCHQKAEQVISPFYHFNEPTYIQKKKEDLADHLLDIEQKKEREPHLNWDKHLEGAKRRIASVQRIYDWRRDCVCLYDLHQIRCSESCKSSFRDCSLS